MLHFDNAAMLSRFRTQRLVPVLHQCMRFATRYVGVPANGAVGDDENTYWSRLWPTSCGQVGP